MSVCELLYQALGYINLERYKEALEDAEKAVQMAPGYVQAYNSVGTALMKLNRPDEALAKFKEAVKINPFYASPYANMANILRELNRPDEAAKMLEKAFQLNPAQFLNINPSPSGKMQVNSTATSKY